MHPIEPVATALPPWLAIESVAAWVGAAERHAVKLLAGLDVATLRRRFAADGGAASRPVFFLDLPALATASALIDRAITLMARAVGDLWPFWWDGEDWSDVRDDAPGLARLPIRLETLAARVPGLSRTWARQAIFRAAQGLPPRVRDVAPETDWAQLCLALAPAGLVVVAELGPEAEAAARARALEWLAQAAPVAVVVLASRPPPPVPPFDRLLHGAAMTRPDGDRHITGPQATGPTMAPDAAPPMLLAAPSVEGRPHPLSPIETRLCALIKADSELAPLFAFNIAVPDLRGITARVDLLWREGRVAVELDGPEHRARATYRADRHRDYELLRAGYHVLRIPNEEVSEDYGRALDKIRDVARLRRRG